MGKHKTLDTIWEVPDDLWEQIDPLLLELDPLKATGRKQANPPGGRLPTLRHHPL